MNNLTINFQDGSFALAAPTDDLISVVLVQNVPQLITKPSEAQKVFFAKNNNFFANYVDGNAGELTDLATNGAFASDTSWTKGTGWTIAAGVASSDGTQSADSDLEQDPTVIVEGQDYYVSFTVTAYTAGNICVVVGGTEGTDRASAATFAEYVTAGAGGAIALRADLDFIGSVDNFSAIPAAQVPSATTSSGRGVELNPSVRELSKISAISVVTNDASGAILTMAFSK